MTEHGPAEPASASCEHSWGHHVRGGSDIGIRMCGLCGLIDWDDLDAQAAAIIAAAREFIQLLAVAEAAKMREWHEDWSAIGAGALEDFAEAIGALS